MSVVGVSLSGKHDFSKTPALNITLVPGMGVKGDSHFGRTVQHRSRLHIKPPPENLRQVHLMPMEVLTGAALMPGQLGENVTTSEINLLSLSRGTKLHFVDSKTGASDGPVVAVTGLRNPCPQIDKFRPGLKEQFVVRDASRNIVGRKAGVMAVVEVGGDIRPGMKILVEEPAVFVRLECV